MKISPPAMQVGDFVEGPSERKGIILTPPEFVDPHYANDDTMFVSFLYLNWRGRVSFWYRPVEETWTS